MEFLVEEWYHIPTIEVQTLVECIPRCIESVLAACGGPTPYEHMLYYYYLAIFHDYTDNTDRAGRGQNAHGSPIKSSFNRAQLQNQT
jgi:hypothetical protein